MRTVPVTPLEDWIARRLDLPAGARPTPAVLAAHQLAALRRTVDHARRNSPFYRRRLAECPTGLQDLDGFARLPFTTAEDIRSEPEAFLAVSRAEIARIVTLETSGTTRAPKRIFFTDQDLERTVDFFHHGMTTLVRPGQRVLILLPGERPASVGDLLRRALARMDVEGVVHGPVTDPGALVRRLAESPVDAMVGLPLQVLALARWPLCGKTCRPKNVLLTADHVPLAVVDVLRQIWDCDVYQHYGMTETGLGGGVECAARDGCHLREADVYVEIVDPASGRPLPDGAPGEVVVTPLDRAGMPLVRYRTGDRARFLPGACPCGSVLRRLDRVEGRLAHRIELAPGHFLSLGDLDEAVLPLPGVVGLDARIETGDGRDRLRVAVQVVPGTDGPDPAARIEAALGRVPALTRALAAGTLFPPSVTVGPVAPGGLGAMLKRNLIDRREGHRR